LFNYNVYPIKNNFNRVKREETISPLFGIGALQDPGARSVGACRSAGSVNIGGEDGQNYPPASNRGVTKWI
jgi:hypothetical protein